MPPFERFSLHAKVLTVAAVCNRATFESVVCAPPSQSSAARRRVDNDTASASTVSIVSTERPQQRSVSNGARGAARRMSLTELAEDPSTDVLGRSGGGFLRPTASGSRLVPVAGSSEALHYSRPRQPMTSSSAPRHRAHREGLPR